MKKNALITVGLLISLISVGFAYDENFTPKEIFAESASSRITIEQARRVALLKVGGTIQNEYSIQDEDENITMYVFSIKTGDERTYEVQVDADSGDVLSVTDLTEDFKMASEKFSKDNEKSEESSKDYNVVEVVEAYPTESYSSINNATVIYSGNKGNDNRLTGDVPPQFTMEQARFVAILRINGEIQSERSIIDEGRLNYAFMIKTKTGQVTEVRVDAISGKAQKIKNRQYKSE